MEHYYTIQGEGFNSGEPAYFLRLGGCDVGCVWCDVKDSWNASKHPVTSVEQMVHYVRNTNAQQVVITGGEPLMYNLDELTKSLQHNGLKTLLETSGAYPLSGKWDWVCVSPKKFKAPLPEMLKKADEIKVIIYNKSDFEWAEQHATLVNIHCKLFLQPEFSVYNNMIPLIVEYVKGHPKWRISLQVHKFMKIP